MPLPVSSKVSSNDVPNVLHSTRKNPRNTHLPAKSDEHDRNTLRKPRRSKGSRVLILSSLFSPSTQAASMQSIRDLDAVHGMGMEDAGQGELQSLLELETISNAEDVEYVGDTDTDTKETKGPEDMNGWDNANDLDDTEEVTSDRYFPPPPVNSQPKNGLTSPAIPLPTPPLVNINIPPATRSIDLARDNDVGDAEDTESIDRYFDELYTKLQATKDQANTLGADNRHLPAVILELENVIADQLEEKRDLIGVLQNHNIQLNDMAKQVALLQLKKDKQDVDLAAQSTTIQTLEAALQKSQMKVTVLTEEKLNWQQRLDGMHDRLHRAEKRLRCLDHVTGIKLDARQSGRLADVKRSPSFAPESLGSEILNQVTVLNAWIETTAQSLARRLARYNLRRRYNDAKAVRTVEVLGESMSGIVEMHARRGVLLTENSLVLRTVVEIFMVHWATMIIEGWYPKQRSFADILAELAQTEHNAPRVCCGAPLNILSTESSANDFEDWAYDILQDFENVVHVAVPIHAGPDPFFPVFRKFVANAWDVRRSLAERDLYNNMELAVVAPETLFQATWMEDLYATPGSGRKIADGPINMERVAGTCRMGLQAPQGASITAMALKPKVVLLSTVEDR